VTRGLLWRTGRLWAYLAMAAVVGGFVLTARGAPWRGEWQWTFDWVAGASILLGPLVAAAVAYEVASSRDFDLHLARPGSRRRWLATCAPALGPTAAMALPYLAVVLVCSVLSAVRRPTDVFLPVLPVIGLLCLLAFAVLGLHLGHRLPPVPAALVAWAAGLTATLALSGSGLRALFRVGGASASLAGSRLDLSAVLAQLVFTCGLVVVGVLTASARARSLTRRAGVPVLGVLTACAGLAVVSDGNLYEANPSAETRCASAEGVRVCLLVGNTTQLSAWAHGLGRLRARVDQPWVTVTSYRQPTWGTRWSSPGLGVLAVDAQRVNTAPPSLSDLAVTLARPGDCAQFAADTPPTRALEAGHWLAEWFRHQQDPGGSGSDPMVTDWIRASDVPAQRLWAERTYDALRTCRLDDVRAPV
jgi:hypothetical protein